MESIILAFDAHCSTCRAVARSVSRIVADKLAVLPLDHEIVVAATSDRDRPVLLEAQPDGSWRQWRGRRIATRLVRLLGPADAFAVLRALGRLRRGDTEESAPARALSRRGFIEAAAGTATVVAIVNGGTAAAAVPAAQRFRALSGPSRLVQLDAALSSPDLQVIADPTHLRALMTKESFVSDTNGLAAYKTPLGTMHHATVQRSVLAGGTTTIDLVVDHDDTAYVLHTFSRPTDGIRSRGEVFRFDPDGRTVRTIASSVNGSRPVPLVDARTARVAGEVPCGGCYWPGDGHTHGYYQYAPCDAQFNASCVLGAAGCVGCTVACAGSAGAACWFCLITSCGSYVLGCCGDGTKKACVECPDGE